jgi:hypothetical protein
VVVFWSEQYHNRDVFGRPECQRQWYGNEIEKFERKTASSRKFKFDMAARTTLTVSKADPAFLLE